MSLKKKMHTITGCCPICQSDELEYNDLIYISKDMVVYEYLCYDCSHEGTKTFCLCNLD